MVQFNAYDEKADPASFLPPDITPVTTATSTWELLLQGFSVADIATRLQVELNELFRTVSELVDTLVLELERMRDCWFSIGMAQLKRLQTAAWEGWTRSWQPKLRKTHKKIRDARGEREEVVTVIDEPGGDPRYLTQYHKCINEIAKWWEKYQSKPSKPAKVQDDPREALNQLIQSVMQRMGAEGG